MISNSTATKEKVSNIDHQRLWARLREEVHNLIDKGVAQIPPVVVLGYMDFLEDIERRGK